MTEFTKISTLVDKKLPHLGNATSENAMQSELREFWRQNMGEVSLHSMPLALNSGRLIIFCDSPGWGTRLRYQQSTLLETLLTAGFNIKEIKIRVKPAYVAPKPYHREAKRMSPKTASQIQSTAETLQHKGLKAALLRLSKRC